MIAPLIAEETLNNKLSMHSVDDRIEGFARAIVASGGRRMSAAGRRHCLERDGTDPRGYPPVVHSVGFQFVRSEEPHGRVNDCELRVTMHNVIGSGPRTNTYVDANSNLGIGNRLIISGSLNAFSHTNQAILPMPGEQFFTAGR